MTAILFLHGGGHADHTRYNNLISRFSTQGILCRAFDHHANTLAGRLLEAENELSQLKSTHQLSDKDIFIWGSSMGGHIASLLTATHPDLKGIILQSAAAYSIAAESLPFGPSFTAELHRENSWEDSKAFPALTKYLGPVLVLYGEHDEVIPTGVKERYISRANNNGQHNLLHGAGHSLLRPSSPEEHLSWEEMYIHANNFLESYS